MNDLFSLKRWLDKKITLYQLYLMKRSLILLTYVFRGVESSTISSINFRILGSNKRFSTNYMTAIGLNQAYTSLKLRKKYNIVLICSFRSITGIYITAINKKLISFISSSITRMIFDWYWKTKWILKKILKITTFFGFSLIYLMIFWI